MIISENIVKIRSRVEYMHKEITVILESICDTQTREFHRHVKFLAIVNNTTPVASIQNQVSILIDKCNSKPETKEKYEELLKTINQFLDIDEFKKS